LVGGENQSQKRKQRGRGGDGGARVGGREAARVSRDPWLGILWRGKRWRRWWCSVTLAERFTPPACFVQEDNREVARGICWAELEWAAGAPLGLFASLPFFSEFFSSSFCSILLGNKRERGLKEISKHILK
jgi:hypothetical protein